MEREVLWKMAPHIIWPLRFVLPFQKGGIRPAWMIRLGLFLYDHLGGRELLPATSTVDLRRDVAGRPLKPLFTRAFEYSDGWVDDARMVVLNARDAADRGARIMPRTEVISVREENGGWRIETRDVGTGQIAVHRARMLINAAGPWVDHVLSGALGRENVHNVRLVQGSHIIVRKKFADPRAYFFQNPDGRIIFAIPYEGDFTLIGTTDRDYQGNLAKVHISEEEIDYLCNAASEYFTEPVRPEDIVWSYSGVRPLFDDGASKAQEATRDYVLKLENRPALLNVFGGKLTTYRRLAEHALEKIGEAIGVKGTPWTAQSHLPGGNFEATRFSAQVTKLEGAFPFLERKHAERLVRSYGTLAESMLGSAQSLSDLGCHFGATLYEAEVRWLLNREWARTADDILWRRTKQGLLFTSGEVQSLEAYLEQVAT